MREASIKSLMRECSAYVTEKTKEIYTLVPGLGNMNGRIMVVGPGPSAKEEATGVFLDGKASLTFDKFLEKASLSREDIYMTYAVKYRPYIINEKTGRIVHKEITVDEVDLFSTYLSREIEIIKPRLLVTLGEIAYKAIAGRESDPIENYGKKVSLTIDEIIYDVFPLPHPKDKIFDKITSKDMVIQGMNVQIGTMDSAIPKELMGNTIYEDEPLTKEQPIEKNITYNRPNVKEAYIGSKYEQPESEKTKPSSRDFSSTAYEIVEPSKKLQGTRREVSSTSGKRKVIVVYGGTNLADDPTYVVVDRVSSVLTELNVTIRRIDLHKEDYSIEAFIDELEESDGVIIATTVEWYGIGGRLQTFLDLCYSSRRFDAFNGAYLLGVVVTRQSFERDAYAHLIKSWELLGGVEGTSILTSISNSADLETDKSLLRAVDKKAEDYYRVINQQRLILPTSIHDHKMVFKVPVLSASSEDPKMSYGEVDSNGEQTIENQMSFISNYDEFMEKQQKDIEDISSLFKERLTTRSDEVSKSFPELFEYKYKPDKTFADCTINWVVNDRMKESFILDFKSGRLKAKFGKKQDGEVVMTSSFDVLRKITEGKLTVQRAFMTGEIKAKGNFTLLYKLDQLFAF